MSKRKKKAEQAIDDAAAETQEEQAVEVPVEEDFKDKYLRALAEMENVRKRSERDSANARKYALEGILRDLLPALDTLEYALAAAGDVDSIREGVQLAIDEMHRVLGDRGFSRIDALHKPFDPRWHEAVGMLPSDEHPPGTILVEERPGYLLHDRVLRPSRVHIAMGAPAEEQAQEAPEEKSEEDA